MIDGIYIIMSVLFMSTLTLARTIPVPEALSWSIREGHFCSLLW